MMTGAISPAESATPVDGYFEVAALSQSGMKDLEVSPLRYWHLHINPNRPAEESTPEMNLGGALHCAVLESEEAFDQRFAREITPEDYPGCLVTIEDMRQWLRDRAVAPKGSRKDEVVAQVLAVDPEAPVFQVLERQHYAQTKGKTMLKPDQWTRLAAMAHSLNHEPRLQKIFAEGGQAEVELFAKDPGTGVSLKAKLDWVSPKRIVDLKTFVQKRGKSIDRSVADAIYYEHYYRQAYLYDMIRRLATGDGHQQFEFIMAFVESEPPHEVRLKALYPKSGGSVNLYWERARLECRDLIYLYADCLKKYGDKPWRSDQEIVTLVDEDIPQLAY